MGWKPAIEETNMMEPFPLFSIWGTVDFANRNAALTFTSNILSHASSGHCKKNQLVILVTLELCSTYIQNWSKYRINSSIRDQDINATKFLNSL